MSFLVFEVLESIQPHNQGWPSPPDVSHGLFATRGAALRHKHALIAGPRRIAATRIAERTVHETSDDLEEIADV
jgi:hypothetical protein